MRNVFYRNSYSCLTGPGWVGVAYANMCHAISRRGAALQAGQAAVQALQESGGAIAVAAGGTFCLALTALGKVVVWGRIGGPAGQRSSRPAVAEIMGLPPITSIAAGQSHALMTDGEHVWALGRQAHMLGPDLMLVLLCCMSLVSCTCLLLLMLLHCCAGHERAAAADTAVWFCRRFIPLLTLHAVSCLLPGQLGKGRDMFPTSECAFYGCDH